MSEVSRESSEIMGAREERLHVTMVERLLGREFVVMLLRVVE